MRLRRIENMKKENCFELFQAKLYISYHIYYKKSLQFTDSLEHAYFETIHANMT